MDDSLANPGEVQASRVGKERLGVPRRQVWEQSAVSRGPKRGWGLVVGCCSSSRGGLLRQGKGVTGWPEETGTFI